MTTIQTNQTGGYTTSTTDEVALSQHDRERSSGLPFFAPVLGYLIALPAFAVACASLGIV